MTIDAGEDLRFAVTTVQISVITHTALLLVLALEVGVLPPSPRAGLNFTIPVPLCGTAGFIH